MDNLRLWTRITTKGVRAAVADGPEERTDTGVTYADASDAPGDHLPAPELTAYSRDLLERQPPDRLEAVVAYTLALASWEQDEKAEEATRRREAEAVNVEALEGLEERGVSTEPTDYEGSPDTGRYVTVKEPKEGYRYLYFQWREGDTWKNEYIAPVDPKGDS